jgi:hypothetical protein
MALSVIQGMVMEDRTVYADETSNCCFMWAEYHNYPKYGKKLALITNPLDFHKNYYAMLISYQVGAIFLNLL